MFSPSVFIHEYVTGGGFEGRELPSSWAAEGRAMRRALAEDFQAVEGTRVIVALDSRFADEQGSWTVVRPASYQNQEPAMFAQVASEADFCLIVAPETDRILEERARILRRFQVRSLGSTVEAIALAGDKLALAEHWKRQGIPTPDAVSVPPGEPWPRRRSAPVVLKPRFGAGCLETFVVEPSDEIAQAIPGFAESILQPYIFGESFSASFLIGPDGTADWIGIASQAIDRQGLRLVYRGGSLPIPIDPESEAVLRRAVECVPGLRGWVGVDFVRERHSGRVFVLEINPRPTTSLVAWTRKLGPGRIAERWLSLFQDRSRARFEPIVRFDPRLDFSAVGVVRAQTRKPVGEPNSAVSLALDVGGANVKAADSRGRAWNLPFELWKHPEGLADFLRRSFSESDAGRFDRVSATLTGELCDCFETKAEGVRSIVASVQKAFPKTPLRIWGTDGRFHRPEAVFDRPEPAAAANWSALAAVVASRFAADRAALLVDIGSTTTDIIPLRFGRIAARGRTDTDRLRTGELVYLGARRTPICALADRLPYRGTSVGVMAEWFACTLDVYLALGRIAENPADRSTADGRPATAEWARDRLARTIGADRSSFDQADAGELAEAVDAIALSRLSAAALGVVESLGEVPKTFIVSGSGAFLAERVVRRIASNDAEIVSLAELWGAAASAAACAHALILLEREQQ